MIDKSAWFFVLLTDKYPALMENQISCSGHDCRHGPKPGCQEAEAEAEALTLFKLEAEAEALLMKPKPKPGYL